MRAVIKEGVYLLCEETKKTLGVGRER